MRARTAAALPVAAFLLAIGVAVAGWLVTGSAASPVTDGVEGASARATAALGGAAALLPFGYAFVAGMVSAVNPCGFGLLAAYLGLYVGDETAARRSTAWRALRGLAVGLAVTAGFVALFTGVGLVVGAGAQALVRVFPWIGLAVGVVLVAAGAWMLRGGALYSAFGERLAEHIGDPRQVNTRGYFLFGISYGAASLSCTLPIFLTVAGGSFAAGGLAAAMGQLALYGAGMGTVILALTLSVALFQAALVRRARRLLPAVRPIGAALLLVVGSYVIYYWLTQGGLTAGAA